MPEYRLRSFVRFSLNGNISSAVSQRSCPLERKLKALRVPATQMNMPFRFPALACVSQIAGYALSAKLIMIVLSQHATAAEEATIPFCPSGY